MITVMIYVGGFGVILGILGLQKITSSAGGAKDKRFKTGRKDNKQTNISGMKSELYYLIAGGLLIFISYLFT